MTRQSGLSLDFGEAPPPIEVFDEVGSTNDIARERALTGAPHGAAVRARTQRAGRGQQGHGWTSPAGGLYLSVVLWPDVAPSALPGVSAACGIGVVRALRAVVAADVQLKWPNDIVCGKAKLGGILVESSHAADGRPFAVCGVGINVDAPQVEANSPGALAATGLAACMGPSKPVPDVAELAELVRAGILDAVDAWAAAGGSAPLEGISDSYHELLAFLGEPVDLITKDGRGATQGVLVGVDPWGRAEVRLESGGVAVFDAAQHSLRPA